MRRSLAALLLVAAAACVEESFKPGPVFTGDQLYWDLELDHRAVLLSTAAPHDTLRLVATPRTVSGAPIDGLPAATYHSTDPGKVLVSEDGTLQAVAPTPPGSFVRVVATLAANNLRHADTVYVGVTGGAASRTIAGLSLAPRPPKDSAKIGASSAFHQHYFADTLGLVAFDTNGDTIFTMPGDTLSYSRGVLPVHVASSDTNFARVAGLNPAAGDFATPFVRVSGFNVGTSLLIATTTAYGVTVADTLEYRIGWPIARFVPILTAGTPPPYSGENPSANIFVLPEVWVGVGGMVAWDGTVDSTVVTDVVFEDEDLPNIAPFLPRPPAFAQLYELIWCSGILAPGDCTNGGSITMSSTGVRMAARRFLAPGTYEYHSPQHPNSRGRVVVVDER